MNISSFFSTSTAIINRRPPPPLAAAPPIASFSLCFNAPFTRKNHCIRFSHADPAHSSNQEPSGFDGSYVEKEGFDGKNEESQATSSDGKDEEKQVASSHEILKRLKRYGISGVLSYGLLNTAYYLTTFLVVWFYVAPAPGKMGYLAAVERFLKVMAMVWAGSQVTKIVRAGGALAMAPLVDKGLSWFTSKFGFDSQWKAFIAIAAVCFGLAFLLFLVVTLLWA